MRIKVLGFATAADALGGSEVAVELAEGSRLADLRRRLEGDHPALVPLWPRLAVAVDGHLATGDAALADGAEVALLPPVSGGSGAAADVGPPDRTTGEETTRLTEAPSTSSARSPPSPAPDRGAVVVFLGTVRNHHQGRPVERLTYSAYRPMAAHVLRTIVADLEADLPRPPRHHRPPPRRSPGRRPQRRHRRRLPPPRRRLRSQPHRPRTPQERSPDLEARALRRRRQPLARRRTASPPSSLIPSEPAQHDIPGKRRHHQA